MSGGGLVSAGLAPIGTFAGAELLEAELVVELPAERPIRIFQ